MITKFVTTIFGVLIFTGIAVLALMPSPDVRDLQVVPENIGNWLDTHDFERNIMGGAILQMAVMVVFFGWGIGRSPSRLSGIAGVTSLAIFSITELAQLFLPQRTFDWMDIGAAILGISAINVVFLAISLPVWAWLRFRM